MTDKTKRVNALTITVEEAATMLGIAKHQAYAAAKNGQIPTIMIGERRRVPVPALRRLVGLDDNAETEAA